MDAKITKERLGNFLAYDWLKMLGCGALAVVLVMLVLTMSATRLLPSQKFSVYGYQDLLAGDDMSLIDDTFAKNVFSYEVFAAESESFAVAEDYSGQVFLARRSVGDGDVMFISNVYDGTNPSQLQQYAQGNGGLMEKPEAFLQQTGAYLNPFFGGDYKTGTLNEEEAEKAFRARNTGDKRFKKEAQIQEGIRLEKERLNKIRDDLLYVEECFANGLYSYTSVKVTNEAGVEEELQIAIHVGNLKGISRMFSYTVEKEGVKERATEQLNLMLFHNPDDGEMRYDTVSYLSYLAKTYATQA